MASLQDTIFSLLEGHPPVSLRLGINKAQLETVATVGELIEVVRLEHSRQCTRDCHDRLDLEPFITLLPDGVQYRDDVRLTPDQLPGAALTEKRELHFSVRYRQPHHAARRRPRTISDTQDEYQLREINSGLRLLRVGGKVLDAPLRLGCGDVYRDAVVAGVVVIDNSRELLSVASGALLKRESKLCIVVTSGSSYMVRRISTLLRLFHDRLSVDLYKRICNPLDMVQLAQGDLGITPSSLACITVDFSLWPLAPNHIPTRPGEVPAVPETEEATQLQFWEILRKAFDDIHEAHDMNFAQLGLASSLSKMGQLNDGHKLLVVVNGLSTVFERPLLATAWLGARHPGMDSRRRLVSESFLQPLFSNFLATNGIVQKLVFADSELPDWVLGEASIPSEMIVDLSRVPALQGFHHAAALEALGVPSERLQMARACVGVARPILGQDPDADVVVPERAVALAKALRRQAARPAGTITEAFATPMSNACTVYVSENFDRVARLLAPLLPKSEVQSLERKLTSGRDISLPSDPCIDYARLDVGELLHEDQTRAFAARSLLLGLVIPIPHPNGTRTYRANGAMAQSILKRVREEISTQDKKYRFRPQTAYDRSKGLKQTRLMTDEVAKLDLDNLEEEAYAETLRAYYRKYHHPHQHPINEDAFNAEVGHLLGAAAEHTIQRDQASEAPRPVQAQGCINASVHEEVSLLTPEGWEKRPDSTNLFRCADGTWRLYAHEYKYMSPDATARAMNARITTLKSHETKSRHWIVNYLKFKKQLGSILQADLPAKWTKDSPGPDSALPPGVKLTLADVCANVPKFDGGQKAEELEADAETLAQDDVPLKDNDAEDEHANDADKNADDTDANAVSTDANAVSTDANAVSTDANADGTDANADGTDANADGTDANADGTDANDDEQNEDSGEPKQPETAAKKMLLKTASEMAQEGCDQAIGYRDTMILGVGDELGATPGITDWRFTDIGAGITLVVIFTIVNVAGILFFVKRHQPKQLPRRIAVIDVYPWTKRRTRKNVQTLYTAKKQKPGR